MPNLDTAASPWVKVQEVSVGATAVTSVSFAGLNIAKGEIYKIESEFSNSAGAAADIRIFFNGNTTLTNYYTELLQCIEASLVGTRYNGAYFIQAESYVGKSFASTMVNITQQGYGQWVSDSNRGYDSGSYVEKWCGSTTTTLSSITSITLTCGVAAGIANGSKFTLYKLVAPKLFEVLVSAATTNVLIENFNAPINNGEQYLLVEELYRPTGTATGTTYCYVDANGTLNTTNTNYAVQEIQCGGATIAGSRGAIPHVIFTAASSYMSAFTNIMGVDNYPTFNSSQIWQLGTSTLALQLSSAVANFTTNAITKMQFTASTTSGIGINSRFALYRLK